jgi:regulator of sigma E protease
MKILWYLLSFIIAIGILTIVHEFGHFIIARWCDVKVLRFAIGFGKTLLKWRDKSGTEYCVCALPFGGYIKMLDENEAPVAKNELHRAFNNKSVWLRSAIVIAGPAFNLLFAVIAYWIIFVNGVVSAVPLIGTIAPGSIAAISGLKTGQEIVAINGKATNSWEQISLAFMPYIGEKGFVKVTTIPVKTAANHSDNHATSSQHTYTLDLSNWTVANKEGDLLKSLGIEPFDPMQAVVGKIMPNSAAAAVDLRPNDQIIAIDGKPVNTRVEAVAYIRQKAKTPITLTVQRATAETSKKFEITIVPAVKLLESGSEIGFIGVEFATITLPQDLLRVNRYGLQAGLVMALHKTQDYVGITLQFLYKMLTGKVSLDNISGPISIAKYSGQSAKYGLNSFLNFLALISISLGVLNLLPIPVLDGGHLLFYSIEILRGGKPVPKRFMEVGNAIGIVMLSGLMILAIVNDLLRF